MRQTDTDDHLGQDFHYNVGRNPKLRSLLVYKGRGDAVLAHIVRIVCAGHSETSVEHLHNLRVHDSIIVVFICVLLILPGQDRSVVVFYMREFVLKMQGALFVLAAAACGSFANGYGQNQQQPAGVGAYAYQDSNGNRYGGTYDLGEEDVQNFAQNVPRFSGQEFAGFPPGFPFVGPDFASEFFRSLQQSLQQAFPSNPVHQQAALRSVNNAFDNSYSHAGYPNPFQGAYHGFGKENIGNYQHPQGSNSAYAAGAINPQGSRQVASISPGNSNYPNVDVSSRSGGSDNGGNKFYSVSSSSFASSVDQDGKKSETRGAKTIVNDNGRVKEYNVHS